MLEAADILKSFGKELLCLVPRDSMFMQTTNKIQNAMYWLNASLRALPLCNGQVTEIPVSDFDVPQFGEPVFTQQLQQEQPLLQEQPKVPLPSTMHTKHTAPAAAAGSAEQQATDVVDVPDPENVDPDNPEKAPKKFKNVLPDPCNIGTDLYYKEYYCYHVNIKDPKYNTKRGAPTHSLSLMTQCVILGNHLILQGKWLNMCHRTIQQTVPGHVLSVAQQHQKENIPGSMLGHNI